MRKIKGAVILFLALALVLPVVNMAHAADEPALVIRGDGVGKEISFTLAEIKAMTEHISRGAYSALNTWPTRSVYYAEGIDLAALLDMAGLVENATMINIAEAPATDGSPGYNMSFLLEDLLIERYTFEGTKAAVPAIIAFRQSERSFETLEDTDFRLIFGQLTEQDQTSIAFVKSVRTITVSCDPAKQLPKPQAAAEQLPDGRYSVSLNSSNTNAKVHYTTDGSTPTVHSTMYNISANHWQPHLNVPFVVSGDTVVKAIAVAIGFQASDVLEFTPASLTGGAQQPGESGMANFKRVSSYTSGRFTDVDEDQWYGLNNFRVIANVFEYGLMKGTSDTVFNPSGRVTIAEAVTVAARVLSIYAADGEDFAPGEPWYTVYVDYAIAAGIITDSDFADYNREATRAEMAYIFSRSLPQSEFSERNTVNSLPDVTSTTPYYDSILMLYKAGVVAGSDGPGTFHPGNSITRAEAATIISRVILPDTREAGRVY